MVQPPTVRRSLEDSQQNVSGNRRRNGFAMGLTQSSWEGNRMNIKVGQRVFFKPEWMDEGDEDATFICVEVFDESRILIEMKMGWRFNPTQSVMTYMIERTEDYTEETLDPLP